MGKKLIHQCEKCGKEMEVDGDAPMVSECCAASVRAMEEVPFCTTAPSAEHARGEAEDEPCDDGRAGKE